MNEKEIEAILRDADLFKKLAESYKQEAEALELLEQDEASVVAKLEAGNLDEGMTLLNGILKGYSPNLKAEWE